jgi:SAM-dependent methyltransferase
VPPDIGVSARPHIAEFDDPRLAAIYDTVNTHHPDEQPAFVRRVVDEVGARTVLDVGCGTGLISRALAAAGLRVIGVEPSPAMVAVGRAKPHGDLVEWIVAGVELIGEVDADLAILTSHVAQFFVDDRSWHEALVAIRRGLRPGGHLAFESRDPRARAWERWTPHHRSVVVDPVAGPVEWWADAAEPVDGVLAYDLHYRFLATGGELVSHARLRFRSLDELTRSLDAAGFTVERVEGDWHGGAVRAGAPELVVLARRTP